MSEPVRSTPPPPPGDTASDVARVQQLASARDEIVARLKQRIVGQDEVIELLLIALFARGHGLFVGVPGLAKTLLITTLADALSLHSNRIQFTPDLMPSDITGTEVLAGDDATTGKRHFKFHARSGVRQHRAGRRNQPGAAQDAVRASWKRWRSVR